MPDAPVLGKEFQNPRSFLKEPEFFSLLFAPIPSGFLVVQMMTKKNHKHKVLFLFWRGKALRKLGRGVSLPSCADQLCGHKQNHKTFEGKG